METAHEAAKVAERFAAVAARCAQAARDASDFAAALVSAEAVAAYCDACAAWAAATDRASTAAFYAELASEARRKIAAAKHTPASYESNFTHDART
jgi:hypothetical protein